MGRQSRHKSSLLHPPSPKIYGQVRAVRLVPLAALAVAWPGHDSPRD